MGSITKFIICRAEVRNAVDHETAKVLAEAFRSFESNKEAGSGAVRFVKGAGCHGHFGESDTGKQRRI